MRPRCWLPRRSWWLEHNQCHGLSYFYRLFGLNGASLPPPSRSFCHQCLEQNSSLPLIVTHMGRDYICRLRPRPPPPSQCMARAISAVLDNVGLEDFPFVPFVV